MTQARVREQLLRERVSPIWLVGAAAAGLALGITIDGFSWGAALIVPVIAVIIFVVIEAAFRLTNYAIFHEDYVDISQRGSWAPPKLTIPYWAVTNAQVGNNGLVEVELDLDRLPEKAANRIKTNPYVKTNTEEGRPVLLLRAKNPHSLSTQFKQRIGSASRLIH